MTDAEGGISFPLEAHERAAAQKAAETLAAVAAMAREMKVQCATVHVREEFPADAIIKEADEQGCDAIVMASHGRRGMARFLLGSQALNVLTHSTVPVLICR